MVKHPQSPQRRPATVDRRESGEGLSDVDLALSFVKCSYQFETKLYRAISCAILGEPNLETWLRL